mmetsp:Transcript_33688/g.63064  ORF Transcript_33688/g.63064 Transcript_33688/m.63064 type:complete len:105 (-) Transcript_33688:110-424(-)
MILRRPLWVLAMLAALAAHAQSSQSFMQRRVEAEAPASVLTEEQKPSPASLPKSLVLLDDLERLVERREKAMERTSWALGLLCFVALGSAGFSIQSLKKSPKVD